MLTLKRGLKNYNLLKRLPNRGQLFERAFRHLSSQCLHDEKNGFIILDTLSGNVRDLSPLKISKNNIPYFDMNFQVESSDLKRFVCFSKQRYELFRKVNYSGTEGVVIKRPRLQNDDILITPTSILQLLFLVQWSKK